MTRKQDNTIERLALTHGRVAIRDGFADGIPRVTIPNGAEFRITEDGYPLEAGLNFSIDWNA